MSKEKQKPTIKSSLLNGTFLALVTMFAWEMVEEGLETLLAYAISGAFAVFITKALSTLAIVSATQGIKLVILRFLFPLVKTIIYKEGNDKMNGFLSFLKKGVSWLYANKCTLLGALTAIVVGLSGSGVIDVNSLPAIDVVTQDAIEVVVQQEDVLATEIVYEEDGVTIKHNIGDIIVPAGTILVEGQDAVKENITPYIYYTLLGIFGILASFFPESIGDFKKRVAEAQLKKEENKIIKEAQKELKAEEQKLNQTQAEQEKADKKAEADRIANEKKALEESIHRQKVEEAKQRLLAEKQGQ